MADKSEEEIEIEAKQKQEEVYEAKFMKLLNLSEDKEEKEKK